MVKVSKEVAAQNRSRIVAAAMPMLRHLGPEAVTMSKVAKAANLTHGAVYSHFTSKDDLICAVIESNFDQIVTAVERMANPDDYVQAYLTREHRDWTAVGCPAGALSGDIARASPIVQKAFCDGAMRLLGAVERQDRTSERSPDRDKSIRTISAMIGALIMARAFRNQDIEMSDRILESVKESLLTHP